MGAKRHLKNKTTISIDAMGGDFAPDVTVEGASLAHKRHNDVYYLLFGNEEKIKPILDGYKNLIGNCEIVDTKDVITNEMKPSVAIRSGRNSSLWKAIESVKKDQAQGVVSSGNTGALMAMSKICLRTLPCITRPAITTLIPTQKGASVVLDLGGNTECNASNLVEFAIMGSAYSKICLNKEKPTVGLLNIGSEEMKGREEIKEAANIIRSNPVNFDFKGFVEGHDIGKGEVDVVVTDGFTGNVALKTIEGTAKLIGSFLKEEIKKSPWYSKLGYLLLKPAFKSMYDRMDPRLYNGAMFAGLNGVSVKSHGGTDGLGFSVAINTTIELIQKGLNNKIKEELSKIEFLENK